MKNTGITVIEVFVVLVVIGLAYGGWKLDRYLHYKFSYQNSVQVEIDNRIKPLVERIDKLEFQLKGSTNKL